MGEAGTYTVLTNVEGRQIGGAMNPPMEGVPPHWNVYFNVEDVDASVAKAEELGGTGRRAGVRRAGRRPDGDARRPAGRDVQGDGRTAAQRGRVSRIRAQPARNGSAG